MVSQPKGQARRSFPTEYNFATAPKLKVPGDWNTQRESLLYYEGPIWYERDFTYEPKEHTHIFLHIGAANYRTWFWVNGQKVCEHEGGFTAFNCDVTRPFMPVQTSWWPRWITRATKTAFPALKRIGGTTAASRAKSR